MSSALERALAVLELLTENPKGLQVSIVAQKTGMPVSGAHRLLNELARHGYVRQEGSQGEYALTVKLAAMGLHFMGKSGIGDIAQPILDRLASISGELIRLSVLDEDKLVWVAAAQGATSGLRYDPGKEQGVTVHLASTAGGQALLSTMPDEEALMLVAAQGFVSEIESPGVNAPRTAQDLLKRLEETRRRGYSNATDSYIVGMAAMAVPVRYVDGQTVIGCLSIAGPAVRLSPQRMDELAPALKEAAEEIGSASDSSLLFRRSSALRKMGEAAG
ncbi:MAG: IclR family transcriptional regulator [Nitratireductor sp.]|nr:IclR family transcriptional regulator [Nitratireductor sp.]MCC0019445.1 IclR family transcriptional regulator [Nitratireductor sp.]